MTSKKLFECISAYLPYGLMLEYDKGIPDCELKTLGAMSGGVFDLGVKHLDESFIRTDTLSKRGPMPLLHPMERLSNGEYLIAGKTPLEVLSRALRIDRGSLHSLRTNKKGLPYGVKRYRGTAEPEYRLFKTREHRLINRFLLRHHFDVFNIIGQGLAIAKPV